MARPVDPARAETTRLGSYEIVRKLARGGMAELLLARTVGPGGFEKLVVLKRILPTLAESAKFVRLFVDEAKLAATLDHPHIAHVYDMDEANGHYFFAMEYVHGQDVRTTMRQSARAGRQLPIDLAVLIARNVATALHYAHERTRPDGTLLDLVHRDVSPSNILLAYEGGVKLVDFGVAKAATSTVKTRTGTLKGKIAYMSPEQAKGAPTDRRSDIFSLGIVLWEMVTGHRLFKADNDLATIQMIINSKARPPSQLRGDCPRELDRIVLRALAPDVDQRYQTAEQLQLDLDALARDHKLTQSTVVLRTYMHELFADEIHAWTAAQASGQTLTEHVIERATQMTAPISESEVYLLDELDLDDEDASSESAVPTAQTAALTQPVAASPHPTADLPRLVSPVASDQAPTMVNLPPVDVDLLQRATPFPIAPREWRPGKSEAAIHVGAHEQRTKRILIGASIAFAVIVFVVSAFIVRDPRSQAAATDTDSAPARIEMKSTPTPTEPTP